MSGRLHVCMCTMSMPDAHGSKKRASLPQELELQMVVSYQEGARNQTWVPSARAESTWNHFPLAF